MNDDKSSIYVLVQSLIDHNVIYGRNLFGKLILKQNGQNNNKFAEINQVWQNEESSKILT